MNARSRCLNEHSYVTGPIVYWMSRDQRVHDNWALVHAQELATKNHQPLIVVFNLLPHFSQATWRQYGFMIAGLQELEQALHRLDIPFVLLLGSPTETIPQFIKQHHIGAIVTDFSPLKIYREWQAHLLKEISIPYYEVDTHNIVPCWTASTKQEFSAKTLRGKLAKLLPEYLVSFPTVQKQKYLWPHPHAVGKWQQAIDSLQINLNVDQVQWIKPGELAAKKALKDFIQQKLAHYTQARNDPTKQAQSALSPYLHFGQLSAQRIALEVQTATLPDDAKAAFLEELIVRRELADNFCFFNKQYDSFNGFPAWARKTLDEHRRDQREYIYTREQFEKGSTHDPLWNTAQRELITSGKMHGFMRMYWAKKILEWSASPEEALAIGIYLNDTYELDGRDPNGYTGLAWSIGGVHDRPWFDRPVYGKIRYMNANGCARKFDVDSYISSGFRK